jgi:hypothetical protein
VQPEVLVDGFDEDFGAVGEEVVVLVTVTGPASVPNWTPMTE